MSRKITCKQAVDYISKKEEKKLSASQRFQLWQHLGCCSLCSIFSEQNKLIIQAFRNSGGTPATLTAQEKEAIVAAVTK